MSDNKNFTTAAQIQDYWLETIAPNYFDFENTNNYRVGVFGYTNELMSNAVLDTHKAMQVARREFYPISAQNLQSLYKMGAIQKIGLPVASGASCKGIIYLSQDEIINNSTYNDGIYTCVIDNGMTIMADTIPFLLDYPITIISKRSGGVWKHTIHYDMSEVNSLSTITNNYIGNKILTMDDGKKYVLMSVLFRQLSVTISSQLVTKDSSIDTTTMLFYFDGDLANFDIYYKTSSEATTMTKLTKLPYGYTIPKYAFCYYRLLTNHLIEISVPKNSYFNPVLNSEIVLKVYTTLGKDGEFNVFNGSLVCTPQSDVYKYNANLNIGGNINSSCTGGQDLPTKEEYREKILKAYSTNNTITTVNDLQIYFNSISADANNKIHFKKKRDDALIRLYDAYCLLKDSASNVVPTNDLTLQILTTDLDVYTESNTRGFIKPGRLFEYMDAASSTPYRIKKVTDLTMVSDLDVYDDNSRFIFTNPFLIAMTLNPNLVGFYSNSLDETKSLEYSYVNDNVLMQFICSSLSVYRNPIAGENFYKFSVSISPSTELDSTTIITDNPSTNETNLVRASQKGMVVSLTYVTNHVVCTVKYADGTTQDIDASSYVSANGDGTFTYHTGYTMNFNVYDTFVANDILATKNPTDLGVIRSAINFEGILKNNDLYIPMVIEKYDSELDTYTITGYISTDDVITIDSTMLIQHGIFGLTGAENENVSINMNKLAVNISIFYNNNTVNYSHDYSGFTYFKTHSMTNTYALNTSDTVSLIQQIDFIRSTLTFEQIDEVTGTYQIVISEIPLAKANWLKDYDNFSYLINSIYTNYSDLMDTYYLLDSNYGINLKFFNTYGKSRFYRVGINGSISALNYINCSFKFGVRLISLSTQDVFLDRFRTYVKDYVESINTTGSSQSIYILNMISSIKTEFPEIGHIEYYGFNTYDSSAQKILPVNTADLTTAEKSEYIPEFINIYTYIQSGDIIPKIEVTLLGDDD